MLFLSSCPSCGTVVQPQASGQVLNLHDARAKSEQKSALPEELVRAWQGPAPKRPTKLAEWRERKSTARPKPPTLPKRAAFLVGAAIVIAAGGTVAGLQLTHHNPTNASGGPGAKPGSSSTPSAPGSSGSSSSGLMAPQTFPAGGLPFRGAFPATPTASQQHLSLLGRSFTATSYIATSGGTTVSVGVYPLPIGTAAHFSVSQVMRTFGSWGSTNGTSISRQGTTKFDGMTAVNVAATANGGKEGGFGIVVMDGHIVYELLVTGPSTSVDTTWHHALAQFSIVRPSLGTTF